ncbi:MAG: TonB-dependent receptor domain-containing protein [Gammaproteobacteria bacterium]
MKYNNLLPIAIICLLLSTPSYAQQNPDESGIDENDQLVSYSAEYFARYQPATALDMVEQIPGFLIDNGESIRGFAESVGNILINDKYPSAKQVSPASILSRIPASQVEKIELIQGQVRGIDLQGQTVLANIILRTDVPASIQWEYSLQHSSTSHLRSQANASFSDRFRNIDYSLGVEVWRNTSGEEGPERVFDGDGNLIEERVDDLIEDGLNLRGIFLNASTWLGDTFIQSNTKIGRVRGAERLTSTRTPTAVGSVTKEQRLKFSEFAPSVEQGIDAERQFNDDLTAKTILLYSQGESQFITRQTNFDLPDTRTLFRRSDSKIIEKEGILRLELDWSGIKDHSLQFNMEGAINTLDGSFSQTRDTGAGPVVIDIPGANSKVEEIRGDFLIKDTWHKGNYELDYGLGAEVSTIKQSGDVDLERTLTFLKPQATLTYSASSTYLIKAQLIREVSQLDFNDFVSASEFEDDDLALGNPDLKPERTWLSEISNEWRPGQNSVYTLSFYYHRINDVEDLLPLTDDFEVPGNIGVGSRWGVRFESTMPLNFLGLDNAKLDFKARWQDSSVTDPVTGESRPLTARGFFSGPPNIPFNSENEYVFDIAFRQDFQEAQVAWGWDFGEQANRPRFKVNELETFNEGLETNVFVETTRWLGIKMRLQGANLLNYNEVRDRFIYTGGREVSPVESRILRERKAGWRVTLFLSGNF